MSVLLATAAPGGATTPAEQKTQLRQVGSHLRKADRFAKAGRADEAAKAFADAQAAMRQLSSEALAPQLRRTFDRVAGAIGKSHAKLSAAGVEVEALGAFTATLGGRGPNPAGEPKGRFDAGQVSFVRDIAPMLSAKCGACHIDGRRGGFSLATYRDLMQGSEGAGRVLTPGDGTTSLIVELIVSGDMPRGGGRVTPAETSQLVTWITQGAKFDGDNENANLRSLRPAASRQEAGASAMADAAVDRPTGDETVSFALDVAPILTQHCIECHRPPNPRAQFSVTDFRNLMRGGRSGAAVRVGDPDNSHLVRRITGDDTPRMPLNRPSLSAEQIKAISTWVREGAKFDGPEATTPLARVAALVRAERATPDELNKIRIDQAERKWRLAMPGEQPNTAATDRFYVVGNLPESRLEEIGAEADRLADGVMKLFGHPAAAFTKGRVTLYAFAHRLDYSEFGLMVQRRETPKQERGATGYDVVDAYAVVQLPLAPQADDALVLGEQIAAIYLAERATGRLPDWFVDGAARYAASQIDPKSETVRGWRELLSPSLAALRKPADVLTDRMAPEASLALRYGFVAGMMRKPSNVRSIVASVAEGGRFDAAFAEAYGKTPAQLVELWSASVRRRR